MFACSLRNCSGGNDLPVHSAGERPGTVVSERGRAVSVRGAVVHHPSGFAFADDLPTQTDYAVLGGKGGTPRAQPGDLWPSDDIQVMAVPA